MLTGAFLCRIIHPRINISTYEEVNVYALLDAMFLGLMIPNTSQSKRPMDRYNNGILHSLSFMLQLFHDFGYHRKKHQDYYNWEKIHVYVFSNLGFKYMYL